jgi:multicomponent Na+:H+ antiporter subunit E
MRMIAIVFVFSFLFYLALTVGSGELILWSSEEIFFGLVVSAVSALLIRQLFSTVKVSPTLALFNPRRWLTLVVYALGPFFVSMMKANLDVAYRIITGRIRPGIVRIPSGLKTDFALSMLANSITLTPGTLSVDTDNKNLYVHWIYVRNREPEAGEVCSSFPEWIRRIAE